MIRLCERLNLVTTNEEVIVVDDSKASHEEKLRATANFDLKYIHSGVKLGVSSKRNMGAQAANGEYLIFFDDDDDFTIDWLADFRVSMANSPDLVQCQMAVFSDNSVKEIVTKRRDDWKLVIPGSWMVKKTIFSQIGGFDIDLKFAENTELFFRLSKLTLKKVYIPKVNFNYFQSQDGGSQNLKNMTDSITIILIKHEAILSKQTVRIYHQILGVNNLRFERYSEARRHLMIAYFAAPTNIYTLMRLCIAYIPALAKKLYPFNFK